jgi:serine/threonine protein kinase
MGAVYRAHDTLLGRPVALKVMRFEHDPGGRQVARFLREARIAAALTHPHLCPVFDFGQEAGVPFLTMPLLQGETLARRLERDQPMEPNEAVQLVRDVARAMAHAHRAGIVHRDLKPSNIMMTPESGPVVIDFGLARSEVRLDAMQTSSGVLIGTPAYIAPEQIGSPAGAGPEADIYSLGVVLYQTLTGRLPFEGSAREILRKALDGRPEPPSSFSPFRYPALDAVCLMAMAADPAARYPSMDALSDALDPLLGRDTRAISGLASVRGKRLRTPAAWAALGLLGLGLATVAIPRLRSPDAHQAAISSTPLAAGSVWRGSFRFRPPNQNYRGDVLLTVLESRDNRIRARYETENGQFAWVVEGLLENGRLALEFIEGIRENPEGSLVGRARLSGSLDADGLRLVFADDDSAADMLLKPAQ